jgi:hypothetical protein
LGAARFHDTPSNTLDPRPAACEKASETWGTEVPPTKTPTAKTLTAKTLTEGQRAYEAKRAAKAGMSLDKWLAAKQREQNAEAKARLKVSEAAKPPKPPGFFGRLLERAQRPLRS